MAYERVMVGHELPVSLDRFGLASETNRSRFFWDPGIIDGFRREPLIVVVPKVGMTFLVYEIFPKIPVGVVWRIRQRVVRPSHHV